MRVRVTLPPAWILKFCALLAFALLLGALLIWLLWYPPPQTGGQVSVTKTVPLLSAKYDRYLRTISFTYTVDGATFEDVHRVCRGPGIAEWGWHVGWCDAEVVSGHTELVAVWKTVCRNPCEEWVEVRIP